MQDLATIDYISHQLKQLNITDSGIKELNDRYSSLTVKDLQDIEGYKIVRDARIHVKSIRVELEKKRKELVENPMRIKQQIDGEAKRRREQLELLESKLEAQERPFEEEKERVKKEKQLQAERIYQSRVSKLTDLGFKYNGVNFILINKYDNSEFVLLSESLKEDEETNFSENYKLAFEFSESIRLLDDEEKKQQLLIQQEKDKIKEEEIAKRNAAIEVQREIIAKKQKEMDEERERLRIQREEDRLEIIKFQKEKEELLSIKLQLRHEVIVNLGINYDERQKIYFAEFLNQSINQNEILKISDSDFSTVINNYSQAKSNYLERQKSLEESRDSFVTAVNEHVSTVDIEFDTEEMITITKIKYNDLIECESFLSILEAAGVDNWDGYDDCVSEWRKENGLAN